ncbi:MAG: LysR family transcriptional regulator [Polyangiaceae bacterium]|nr:LysR family transcriptional regulator [Polyangiaceae bacterium]
MNGIHALAGVDLNLFVAFRALAKERSVTRAAAQLGVTQSAMSHTLRRLRDLAGDPLLVKGAAGMELTPRAETLLVPVESALLLLERGLSEPRFVPGRTRRRFRLATPDLFDALAIPALLERVRGEAPQVSVQVIPVQTPQLSQRLETGEVDVAVMPRAETLLASDSQSGLMRRTLFRDGYACFIRRDHPVVAGRTRPKLTLDRYLSVSHALITPSGEGPGVMDLALEERGLERHVALRLPTFHTALGIVEQTDLILTAPSALATLCGPRLLVLPTPLTLPEHSVDLLWHSRFSADAASSWFRERVGEVAAGIQRKITRR